MARRCYLEENVLKAQSEIDANLHDILDIIITYPKVKIADKPYSHQRKKFGGMRLPTLFSGYIR